MTWVRAEEGGDLLTGVRKCLADAATVPAGAGGVAEGVGEGGPHRLPGPGRAASRRRPTLPRHRTRPSLMRLRGAGAFRLPGADQRRSPSRRRATCPAKLLLTQAPDTWRAGGTKNNGPGDASVGKVNRDGTSRQTSQRVSETRPPWSEVFSAKSEPMSMEKRYGRILSPSAGLRLLKANTHAGTKGLADCLRGKRMRVRPRAGAGMRPFQETFLKRSRDRSAREPRPHPATGGWPSASENEHANGDPMAGPRLPRTPAGRKRRRMANVNGLSREPMSARPPRGLPRHGIRRPPVAEDRQQTKRRCPWPGVQPTAVQRMGTDLLP
jgi:hypothetical protein